MDRRAYLAASGSVVFFGGTTSRLPRTAPSTDGRRDDVTDPPGGDQPRFEPSTRDELLDALRSAARGDLVRVPTDATLDLSGEWTIRVPDGVTLASGSQEDGGYGAVLETTGGDEAPERGLQKLDLGAGARITGFQIRGHHHEYVNPIEEHDGDYYAHRGSGVRVGTNAVVDHNDISGWTYASVWAEDNAHVHNNYIHHNVWDTLGYGVVVPAGDNMPVIEHNEFDYNRHAIAGGGGPEVGYVARHNVVGPHWFGAQFDMHGDGGMVGIAGNEIVIRDNIFEGTHTVPEKTRNPNSAVPAIHIRGTPETGVWVEDNRFYHEDRDSAYQQTDGPHRAHFSNNTYGRPDEGTDDEAPPNATSED